ncbi:hypothetical protein [Nitratireductor aestuarii]|nr:hypothetical protein [Nitratireductor aestuarii]
MHQSTALQKVHRNSRLLLNEASYYVSDKDLYRGNVIGLPVFGGTVRMQSGGIGLVFKEPKDGPSAKDLVGFMRRMEGVELLGKSNSIDLRTLILKDLLSGASFIEGHPFTNAGISIRTFDLANVTIGTDNIARVSLNMTGYSPNEAQPAGSQYSTPTEVLRSAPPESQLGPKINDRFEENVYSGPIITEVSDDEEVSYADVIDPLLHSPGISEDSDRAVVSFDDVSQASATPSESLLMPWALLGSLFGPDAFASNPQIGELAAALAPGGRLYGQRLQEVLKHDAFKRIALREKELRDDLGKLIKESRTTEADKKLKKLEAKEDKKLKKLEAKEPAVQSSEQQLQVVKSKTKQGLASRIRRTFSGQVKISKDATN